MKKTDGKRQKGDDLSKLTPEQLAERRRIIRASINKLKLKLGRAALAANPGIGKMQ
ncbi:hypothetical protein HY249_00475 [Candidatus Azambacteria bacterium]|nr:hypothetical protein [Candidatus Azambacteria bacterium]